MERDADSTTRLTHSGVLPTYYAEALILPGTGTGVVALFNSYHALAPYYAIVAGVAAIVQGRAPAARIPFAVIEVSLGCLTVLVLATRIRRLARSRSWAAGRRGVPAWRLLAGLLRLLVPAGLLVALPNVVATFTGRVYSRHQRVRPCRACTDCWVSRR
ncbi:hypothetical protein [Actinoplanes nipponensis]|uniref:hypothetical protein n=1 Tax=Actinoplanes nipponensis TaxID=135950 RepID=UPI0027DE131D|nr:hypothetical protein [Actinoplanes nipponensis]